MLYLRSLFLRSLFRLVPMRDLASAILYTRLHQTDIWTSIGKLFVPSTQHIKKPILLILAGHGSLMDIAMIDFLVQHDIHLYCLPPHTTYILQPLDVASFKPLKAYFSKLTDFVTLASLGERDKVTICKKDFTAIFNQAYTAKMNLSIQRRCHR